MALLRGSWAATWARWTTHVGQRCARESLTRRAPDGRTRRIPRRCRSTAKHTAAAGETVCASMEQGVPVLYSCTAGVIQAGESTECARCPRQRGNGPPSERRQPSTLGAPKSPAASGRGAQQKEQHWETYPTSTARWLHKHHGTARPVVRAEAPSRGDCVAAASLGRICNVQTPVTAAASPTGESWESRERVVGWWRHHLEPAPCP